MWRWGVGGGEDKCDKSRVCGARWRRIHVTSFLKVKHILGTFLHQYLTQQYLHNALLPLQRQICIRRSYKIWVRVDHWIDSTCIRGMCVCDKHVLWDNAGRKERSGSFIHLCGMHLLSTYYMLISSIIQNKTFLCGQICHSFLFSAFGFYVERPSSNIFFPHFYWDIHITLGLPRVVLVVKNPPANEGDPGDLDSIPGSGRSPGGGHGNPLQYSCLENPMDRDSLVGYSP